MSRPLVPSKELLTVLLSADTRRQLSPVTSQLRATAGPNWLSRTRFQSDNFGLRLRRECTSFVTHHLDRHPNPGSAAEELL